MFPNYFRRYKLSFEADFWVKIEANGEKCLRSWINLKKVELLISVLIVLGSIFCDMAFFFMFMLTLRLFENSPLEELHIGNCKGC